MYVWSEIPHELWPYVPFELANKQWHDVGLSWILHKLWPPLSWWLTRPQWPQHVCLCTLTSQTKTLPFVLVADALYVTILHELWPYKELFLVADRHVRVESSPAGHTSVLETEHVNVKHTLNTPWIHRGQFQRMVSSRTSWGIGGIGSWYHTLHESHDGTFTLNCRLDFSEMLGNVFPKHDLYWLGQYLNLVLISSQSAYLRWPWIK